MLGGRVREEENWGGALWGSEWMGGWVGGWGLLQALGWRSWLVGAPGGPPPPHRPSAPPSPPVRTAAAFAADSSPLGASAAQIHTAHPTMPRRLPNPCQAMAYLVDKYKKGEITKEDMKRLFGEWRRGRCLCYAGALACVASAHPCRRRRRSSNACLASTFMGSHDHEGHVWNQRRRARVAAGPEPRPVLRGRGRGRRPGRGGGDQKGGRVVAARPGARLAPWPHERHAAGWAGWAAGWATNVRVRSPATPP